ncbi:unnamed protein product [Cylicocyclus nassatus]|uniref:Centriolar and ciliogenesis-associated protein HYLS1 C-terminal domain-containing protein n=1 Tax=Cylicocyclus nassatus TaxID=53992 RepID=A0AA36DR02_CYLNA|nr:unnamed protein product [Cylicocyclus nassatus]
MSGLSSSDEYTEEDLLHVCEDLGLPCDEENVGLLRDAIDEIILESESGSDDERNDGTLFGGLSLSDSLPSTGRSGSVSPKEFASPIRRSDRNNLSHPGYHGEHGGRNREVPLDLPTSQENEELRRYNPTAYFLLNDAWRCLSNVYGTMSIMEDLQIKLSSTRRRSSSHGRVQRDILRLDLRDENKENRAQSCNYRDVAYPKYSERSTETGVSNDLQSAADKANFQPDPSIRPVNRFVPGQLLYRHDPVKRFELYREEWARKPAPGEQKRLALRWKVREYMLRHDIPQFDPRNPPPPTAFHPKDWSPRPYID